MSIKVRDLPDAGIAIPNDEFVIDRANVTYRAKIGAGSIPGIDTAVAVWLGAPSSANLLSAMTDKTGTGFLVFNNTPTFINPHLGTPADGDLTNCTFPTLNQDTTGNADTATYATSAGSSTTAGSATTAGYATTAGNADTVTTNANLTGPITSSGNATSVASQTGTGSKFVMDTSPTLVTPNLGTPSAGSLGSCNNIPVDQAIGNLPVANLNSGTSASATTFWRGDGTWSTPSGSGIVNSGTLNGLAYYASAGTTVSSLTTANSSILTTDGSGVPAWVAYTGSGAPVRATSPTLVTPALGTPSSGVITNCTGAPTLTSLAFSSTTGIIGTTTNNSAAAGSVGEFFQSIVTFGSPVVPANNTATNITSLSLSAGEWELVGLAGGQGSVSTSFLSVWASTTSATQPDGSVSTTNGALASVPINPVRVQLSGTTTVYLSGRLLFTGSSILYGNLQARRIR